MICSIKAPPIDYTIWLHFSCVFTFQSSFTHIWHIIRHNKKILHEIPTHLPSIHTCLSVTIRKGYAAIIFLHPFLYAILIYMLDYILDQNSTSNACMNTCGRMFFTVWVKKWKKRRKNCRSVKVKCTVYFTG